MPLVNIQQSSALRSFIHRQGFTILTFRTGARYAYDDPDGSAFEALRSARDSGDSIGAVVNSTVRPLPFTRLPDAAWRRR
jgi:chorismate synthase